MPASPSRLRAGILLAALAALLASLGCQTRPLPLRASVQADVYIAGAAFHARSAGDLWIIDAFSPAVKGRLRVGAGPLALAFNPARNELYCLNRGARDLAIFDVVGRRPIGRIPLHATPTAMLLSPDHLYALIAVRIRRQGWVLKLDLPSRTIVARRKVGPDPVALAISLSGTRLLVADAAARQVWILDNHGADLRQAAVLALPGAPSRIRILPYGPQAFVLCPDVNQVTVLNYLQPALVTSLTVGHQPDDMALKPDGGELYVANGADGTVSIIDTSSDEVSGLMLAGAGPMGMTVTADGSYLYVANAQSNTVSVLRLQDRKALADIPVGIRPERLLLGPFGRFLYVLDAGSNDIAVVQTDLDAMLTLLPSPPQAAAMSLVTFHQPPSPAPAS